MKFGEFATRIKTEPNIFWCLSSVSTKMYQVDDSKLLLLNKSIPFAKLKELVFDAKGMFSGGFYCGSVYVFFENEADINLLKIKNPELLD